jgi:beta-fructofuranosidase
MIAGIRYVEGGIRKEPAPERQRETTNPMLPAEEHKKEGWGNLALLKGDDLYHWTYVGHLLYPQPELNPEFYKLDGVYECPDYFVADDGTEVLLSSPQNLPRSGNLYQNIHSTLYMLGHLDFDTGRFDVETVGEVDSGFDFYAAQTLRMPDGRVIMIAWKEMWDRSFPSRPQGWAGTYTLPRELTVEDDHLIQKPVREIFECRVDKAEVGRITAENEEVSHSKIHGNVIELKFVLKPGSAEKSGVKLLCSTEHETLLYYDRKKGQIVFDRTKGGVELTGRDSDLNVRVLETGEKDSIEFDIFLDVISIEAFIDGGRYTMTGNVYPDPSLAKDIRFFAEGGKAEFVKIEKYKIM